MGQSSAVKGVWGKGKSMQVKPQVNSHLVVIKNKKHNQKKIPEAEGKLWGLEGRESRNSQVV